MDAGIKTKALADIDRVLAYQPSYGGTGAVAEIATAFTACILRWTLPGSSYHKMAEAIDPFPTARAGALEQHVRALMASFRRDVEANQVELSVPAVAGPEAKDELRELNGMARRLLVYLHTWAVIKRGGQPFTISPHDPDTLSSTMLDGAGYMRAATWLIRKNLAKWLGSGGVLMITDHGIAVAGDEHRMERELPIAKPGAGRPIAQESGDMAPEPDHKKVFVIHGRNLEARKQMGIYLLALGLDPVNFDDLRAKLKGTPTLADIVLAGMREAKGVIALFTPDEYTGLHPDLRNGESGEAVERWQARQNVLFEAGIAFGIDRERVMLVKLGKVSLPSDFGGIHVFSPSREPSGHRNTLRNTLKAIGCAVNDSSDWMTHGDFEAALDGLPEVSPRDPFR